MSAEGCALRFQPNKAMMLTEQPVGRRGARAVVRASRGFRDECRGLLVTTVPPPVALPT